MIDAAPREFAPLIPDKPSQAEDALRLPVDIHMAASLSAIELANGSLALFTMILRGAPRERDAAENAMAMAALHMRDAHEAYVAALEIANCKGQA